MLLCFACGKDDDTKSHSPTTLLTVEIDENYLTDSTVTAGYVIASKSDGTLLDYKPFVNGSTITLETDEADISELTATIFLNRINSSPQLLSYPKTPAGGTWWLVPDDFSGNTGPVVGTAEMLIEGTGTLAQSPFYVNGASAGVNLDLSNNGMKASFNLRTDDPTVPVLAIYQSTLDNQVRYFFDDALPVGQTITKQHADLPIITSPMTIDFGAGDMSNYYISGVVASPSNSKALLSISEANAITTQFTEHYVPQGVFDEYYVYAIGDLPNSNAKFSSFIYSETLETTFGYPEFDYDVETVADGFDFITASGFSHFFVEFTNSAGVIWTIGSPAIMSGSFRFPTLPTEVLDAHSELSEEFNYHDTGAIRYEPARPVSAFYENLFPAPGTLQPSFTRLDILY